ncbi:MULTISPECIES: hypothetical protein, partial [unclassified Campylobacter]
IEKENLKDKGYKEQKINLNTKNEQSLYILRKELKESLMSLKNKLITNKNNNLKALITNSTIGKISSTKAIEKSLKNGFSEIEHFRTGKHLKELFENAILISENKDKNINIFRFNSNFIINDKNANALLTLKQIIDKDKNVIYSLELENLTSSL